jgi:hypothetical protein
LAGKNPAIFHRSVSNIVIKGTLDFGGEGRKAVLHWRNMGGEKGEGKRKRLFWGG